MGWGLFIGFSVLFVLIVISRQIGEIKEILRKTRIDE
jgi:hypothetical protein